MINSSVKIHDKYSFEIKLGFVARKKKKVSEFAVNSWFFIPNSLDINRSTYDKKDFYRDMKSNIRLITPGYLLRDIATGDNSPFTMLESSFQRLAFQPTRTHVAEYEYHIKMFLSIVKSALRNDMVHIMRNSIPEDTVFLVEEFVENASKIARNYRNLRRIINVSTIQEDWFNYFLFGDEFLSNVIEQHSFMLLKAISTKGKQAPGSSRKKLLNLIHFEIEYKKDKDFRIVEKTRQHKNEELVYRLTLLKKYAENVLFLSARKKKDGILKEQVYYSLAAGLSMVFATAIAFSFQQKYGNFTMPFFVALVVSYMLKDRLKELGRYYFAHKLGRSYFDHKTVISLNENKIGWSKEAMDFIGEENIPDEVLKIRDRSAILDANNRNNTEKIILYRKWIRLNRQSLDSCSVYPIAGTNEIIRFNVLNFTHQMDNPVMNLFLPEEKLDFEFAPSEKNYHINLVMQFRYEDQTNYRRYRIILNREGIRKIESL